MDNMRIGTLAMQVNLWASLGYGLMLLLVPDVFCDLLKAEAVNTAWLRTIGAALIGTNVVGSWLWLKSPGVDMGKVQFATAALEAAAMNVAWYAANKYRRYRTHLMESAESRDAPCRAAAGCVEACGVLNSCTFGHSAAARKDRPLHG